MKIKLVFPRKERDPWAMGLTVPLVLPHLAGITPSGHRIELVDLFKQRLDLSDRPDLVGISVMTPMADSAYRLADNIRERGIPVALGGHHPSALPLEAKKHANAVVVGEAEETWPLLLEDLETGRLKEFYVSDPQGFVEGPPPDSTCRVTKRPSLDQLPLPRRELLKGRYFFDSLVTTRGCQYQCGFCGTPNFYGSIPRHRPVEQVAEEVSLMRRFWLLADDDIFGDLTYRLKLYEKLSGLKRWMRWHGAGCLAAAYEKAGQDVLRLAVKSGLNAVMLGLESAEEDTLSSLLITQKLRQNKEIDFRKTAAGIKVIRDLGIMVAGFFVLGSDTDSRETFDKTLRLCDEIGVIPIPFLLMPLPGTPMWNDFRGRLLPGLSWGRWDATHALFSHPSLGAREREEMLYRLRRTSYTFGRIIKRLKGMPFGAAFFTLLMQLGLRHSFESDWRRVQHA